MRGLLRRTGRPPDADFRDAMRCRALYRRDTRRRGGGPPDGLFRRGSGGVQSQHGTRAAGGRGDLRGLVPAARPGGGARQRRHRGRVHRRPGARQGPGDGAPLRLQHCHPAQGAPADESAGARPRPVRPATDAPAPGAPAGASPGTDLAAAEPVAGGGRRPADRRPEPRAPRAGLRHAAAALRAGGARTA